MSKDQTKDHLQSRILTLQEEIVRLRKEISDQPQVDKFHRENFTKLFGHDLENPLSWAEIYFILGALMSEADIKNTIMRCAKDYDDNMDEPGCDCGEGCHL